MPLNFAWDPAKARSNGKKHGVSFDEAQTVFYDDYARMIHDPNHSENEDRFIIVGMSVKRRMLVVCHSYREQDAVIRIISARVATSGERRHYEETLQ